MVTAINSLPERTRFMKGIFAWMGYDSTVVEYTCQKRAEGGTKWNYWKLWNFALEGITSFSTVPLRVWTYIGLLVSLISFVSMAYYVIRTLFWGIDVPGYASLFSIILFFGGIQLISLGVIGEYLSRVFIEAKQRPIYIVRDYYANDEDPPESEER